MNISMDSISVEKEAIEKMKGCGDLHKTIKLVPSDAEERKRQVHVLASLLKISKIVERYFNSQIRHKCRTEKKPLNFQMLKPV